MVFVWRQFSVDSSGNAFGGTLTVSTPPLEGTVSSSVSVADPIGGSSNLFQNH